MISAKSRYAIMATVDIAINATKDKHVKTSEIANRQKISEKFLELILPSLKKQGILSSTLGPGGGYQLAKDADSIFLIQIIKAVSKEDTQITRCKGYGHESCASGHLRCCTHNLWSALEKRITDFFESITVKDIVSDNINVHDRRSIVLPETSEQELIYMDNNATTIPIGYALAKASTILKHPYNPSSIHRQGQNGREIIEEARRSIKKNLNLSDEYKVIFTSSATEANNMIFNSLRDYTHIILQTDHSSTIKVASNPVIIPVGNDGIMQLDVLEKILGETPGKKLLSFSFANSETGVIQPLERIIEIARKYTTTIHLDAVQAISKIHCRFAETEPDAISISGHKIGGIVGAGALIFKKSVPIIPLLKGGKQESGIRAGTENVAAISALGVACSFINTSVKNMRNIKQLRDYLEEEIISQIEPAVIVAQNSDRLPNTSCVIIPGIDSSTQIMHFDMHGICVSNGSACSSGQIEASHVLLAMGFSEQYASSAIRISLGISNTKNDVDKLVTTWKMLYNVCV